MLFESSSNKKTQQFFGREVGIAFPERKDGTRVLYVVDAKNKKDWLFYTTEVLSINVDSYRGVATITVSTKNSLYTFSRPSVHYYEEMDEDGDTVICDRFGNLVASKDIKPGDTVELCSMPSDDMYGHHATGWSTFKISAQNLTGFWADEYEED